MALTKEQILDCKDCPIMELNVPEWGDSVFIKVMTGAARELLEARSRTSANSTNGTTNNFRELVVVLTVCDENAETLFDLSDIPALSKKSGRALDRIFEASLKFNRIGNEDTKELMGELKEG